MKNTILLLFLLALPVTAAAQNAGHARSTIPSASTELESTQSKTGTVLIKGFDKSQPLKNAWGSIEVEAQEFTDTRTKAKSSGIVIEIRTLSVAYNQVLPSRSFVDLSEINGLIAGIDALAKIDATATKFKNFEASYRTNGNFRIMVYNDETSGAIQVQLECANTGTYPFYLKVTDLPALRKMIADARDMLSK